MHDVDTAYELLKARLDRGGISVPVAQEEYWRSRLLAAAQELERKGINLQDDLDDQMLLADYAAYKIQNRDKPDAVPAWLRLALRERWLSLKGRDTDAPQ